MKNSEFCLSYYPCKCSKLWHFSTWFSGRGGIQSKVGLDLGGLFPN